ncbi:hypothetical protein [Rhabdothermincola salaria]|uniref:hypothetical protein n=1 Tax=Rhabdothermincola salaria TaxID=2903142 RepID=UPI001E538CA4|nr:hypothetical protein [Rhabdothermincola salaria]MCD9622691.1 hypothetical protein [Rhabdothermincola salaria]
MGDRVRVVHDDGGRLVAAKSPPPDEPDRGRREAAILDGLHHPGVVELVGLVDADGEPEVHTRWVGSRSTADLARPLTPARAAGLVVAVAATVRDLHGLGVVHGGLDPSHVLLDPYGRPVLCGFGDARRLDARDDGRDPVRPSDDVAGLGRLLADLLDADGGGASTTRATEADGRRRRDDRRTRAQRRALLGVAAQATGPDPTCRPGLQAFVDAVRRAVPEAALGRPWGSGPTRGADGPDETTEAPAPTSTADGAVDPLIRLLGDVDRGRLAPADRVDLVADNDHHRDDGSPPQGTRRDPDRREGADPRPSEPIPGQFGGATRVVIDSPRADDPVHPSDRLFGDIARLRPDDDPARRPLPVGPVAAVGGVAAMSLAAFFGVSAWLGGTSSATAPAPSVADPPAPTTVTSADPARSDAPATDHTEAASRGPQPAPDASTTTETTPPEGEATVVEHGGRRYAVGGPGDVVAVGDWHCTGREVPAVLRPETGALFVFWSWPEPGVPHATEPGTSVAGGVALQAGEPDTAGCTPLVVSDAQGTTTAFGPEAWR